MKLILFYFFSTFFALFFHFISIWSVNERRNKHTVWVKCTFVCVVIADWALVTCCDDVDGVEVELEFDTDTADVVVAIKLQIWTQFSVNKLFFLFVFFFFLSHQLTKCIIICIVNSTASFRFVFIYFVCFWCKFSLN